VDSFREELETMSTRLETKPKKGRVGTNGTAVRKETTPEIPARPARILKGHGAFAGCLSTVDEFLRHKHEENAREEKP
jgi:hypothetical protein